MKAILLFLFPTIFSTVSYSQNQLLLEGNNARASIQDDGNFFNNPDLGSPQYEIPINSGNHVIYAMTFCMAGIEVDSTIHTAFNGFPGNDDFFSGPIANDYNSTYYTTNFDSSVWKITRDQINFHVGNYTAVGYVPDPAISNWPGNGNISEGIAEQLAPYVDVNNDNIYNPLNGDFPYIQGDQAVYVIMNDEAGYHAQTNGIAFGIEIHAMFYQYESTDDLNNTTFLNTKIYNRRDTNYVDFMFGLWLDIDIGNSINDFIGSDSARSLAYGYNGESSDDGQGGQPGYGSNPPAFGAQFLSEPAGSVIGYDISGGWSIPPTNLYYGMKGVQENGQLLLNGPTPTKFIFNGNPFLGTGWNEVTDGNAAGDHRVTISSGGSELNSGNFLCYDMAFIFNQAAGNAIENVNELLSTADFIQNYYDANIQPCNQIFLDAKIYDEQSDVLIYPNPSNGTFTIQTDSPVKISVLDFSGKLIAEDLQPDENGILNLDLKTGTYIIVLQSESEISYHKIEILK